MLCSFFSFLRLNYHLLHRETPVVSILPNYIGSTLVILVSILLNRVANIAVIICPK